MRPVRLTIAAIPRTKKTSNRTFDIGKRCPRCRRGERTIVKPSEAYEEFEAFIVGSLKAAWGGRDPIAHEVYVEAVFYREALRGDLVGFQQAIADVLEAAQVVTNDRLIVGWPVPADGSPLRKDAARPRIELVISDAVRAQTAMELETA